MTWIEDIGTYLVSQGIGTTANIFYQGFNEDVTNCITLFNQGGGPEDTGASNDYSISSPELGIRVRNVEDLAAYNKAKSILVLLIKVSNTVIGSTHVIGIEVLNSDPLFVEQDENDQFIYSVNFSLLIEGV